MSKEIFKKGDYVYFPQIDTKVYKLGERPYDNNVLTLIDGDNIFTFYKDGGPYKLAEGKTKAKTKAIFKATEENRKLLQALHGVEFDKVQDPLEDRLPHLCLLADDEADFENVNTYEDFMFSRCNIRVVKEITETGHYRVCENVSYKFAKPCRIVADGTIVFIEY